MCTRSRRIAPTHVRLCIILALAVLGQPPFALSEITGVGHQATQRVTVIDQSFDPPRRVDHPDNNLIEALGTIDSDDGQLTVEVGTNDIKGAGATFYTLASRDQSQEMGFPSLSLLYFAEASLTNESGEGIEGDIQSRIDTAQVLLSIDEPFRVAGGFSGLFYSEGFDRSWAGRLWFVSGAIEVVGEDATGKPITPPPLAITGPSSVPFEATEKKTEGATPVDFDRLVEGAVEGQVDISATVLSGVIPDGRVPQLGAREVADWPEVGTLLEGDIHLLPEGYGKTKDRPFKSILKNLTPFRRRGGENGSQDEGQPGPAGSPPPPGPEIRTIVPGDEAYLYPTLPTDSWYRLPVPEEAVQSFQMLDGDLFLGVDELDGFDGPIRVFANGEDLGLFENDDSVDFVSLTGAGVSRFDLYAPDGGALAGDAALLRLSFDSATALVGVVVPEPSALWMVAVGVWAVMRRRRVRPCSTNG